MQQAKMGRRRHKGITRSSQTLPPSPTHSFSSSSSSDFEFTISVSPRKSSTLLCPADELFYKGQLLPLHLSPRISMVRTLLLASSSTSSSSDTTTSASRDSTGSTSSNDSTSSSFTSDVVLLAAECDSSRPSSVTDQDDEFKRLNSCYIITQNGESRQGHLSQHQIKKSKYFSLLKFSSVFKKENKTTRDQDNNNNISGSSSVKKMSTTAKDVIRKYLKKVKPLYEKISQKQQQKMGAAVQSPTSTTTSTRVVSLSSMNRHTERSVKDMMDLSTKNATNEKENYGGISHSFSGNLRYPRRRSCVSSCPSSMRSSPSQSGVLSRNGFTGRINGGMMPYHAVSDTSSMEELQSAIQGAIAHCKNSMLQNKNMVSNEV